MLLDIRLPCKSGVEVLRDYGRKPEYPVVALTGHVDVEAQEQFRACGFDGVLGKPFSVTGLQATLTMALHGNTPWFSITSS